MAKDSDTPHHPTPSTYSIVGADPDADECGIAVQSKFLAVGAFVPWARGGVGAVAVQAFPDITHGIKALDLLQQGKEPGETIDALLRDDELRQHRQLGIVSADGEGACFTGDECFEHAKSLAGENFAAQGNILKSPEVVDVMAEIFSSTEGNLAHRLLSALEAGEQAGGEKRGKESAAMVVVKPGGGYGGNHDRWLDLRVDHSTEPIEQLRELFDLHTLYFGKSAPSQLVPIDNQLADELTHRLEAIGWWEENRDLEENLFSWMGWHNLEERRVDSGLIDPLVLKQLRQAQRGEA